MTMKAEDLLKVTALLSRRASAAHARKTLEEILGGHDMLSMPSDVFRHVDRLKAAKALEPLVREALIEYEKELAELGVEL